jgi:glycopeptide antibiotics resistance protein
MLFISSNYMFSRFKFSIVIYATISAAWKRCSVRLYSHLVSCLFLIYIYLRIMMSTTIFISHAVLFRSLNSNISGDTIGQELLTIPERLHDTIPGVLWESCCSNFCFLCNVLETIVYIFAIWFWPLYSSNELRFLSIPFVSSNFT